jgi:hypothetical protein
MLPTAGVRKLQIGGLKNPLGKLIGIAWLLAFSQRPAIIASPLGMLERVCAKAN